LKTGKEARSHNLQQSKGGREVTIFIDTANLNEIKKAKALGLVDGVTTNPTPLAKEGEKTGLIENLGEAGPRQWSDRTTCDAMVKRPGKWPHGATRCHQDSHTLKD
jgi:hypothetical protein